ncbi:MAG: hypothetical protein HYY40_00795 [Bacteroidetes bacterium]|nr:hypothetical protein [Bacteroidota bacterium]
MSNIIKPRILSLISLLALIAILSSCAIFRRCDAYTKKDVKPVAGRVAS